jgi:hypothetical protein
MPDEKSQSDTRPEAPDSTPRWRCPRCRSTDVEDTGVYEFHTFQCRSCGHGDTVSIIYPEVDWTNRG